MTFDQALAVMDRRLSDNPPRYGEWMVAGEVIADHYRRHPEKLRPVFFTDSSGPSGMRDIPGRTLDRPRRGFADQPRYQPFEKSREWLTEQSRGVRLDESWANIQGEDTPNPGMEVGADLIESLPDDVSSYFIARHPITGKAALYRYKQPQVDPGLVGRSDGTTARTMDRRSYYRSVAKSMNTLRETTGSVLKGINEANRKAWSNR